MNTDEHRLLKQGTRQALPCIVRNLCLSVFICGSKFWQFLRAVLDDDAYEQYVRRFPHRSLATGHRSPVSSHQSPAKPVIPSVSEGSAFLLSPAEFYRLRLEEKYSRPTRCC